MITLANIQEASLQDIFTQVAIHLLTQNAKSIGQKTTNSCGKCVYRNEEGLKCAIGCLIADKEYKPEMDINTSSSLCNLVAENLFPCMTGEKLVFLGALQRLHDGINIINWKNALEEFAIHYELDFPYDKV